MDHDHDLLEPQIDPIQQYCHWLLVLQVVAIQNVNYFLFRSQQLPIHVVSQYNIQKKFNSSILGFVLLFSSSS